jgi:uncharacterized protein YigA (DUF484 family)
MKRMDTPLVTELRAYLKKLGQALEAKAQQDMDLHKDMADLQRRLEHGRELLQLEGGEVGPLDLPAGRLYVVERPKVRQATLLADTAREVLIEAKAPMHFRPLTRAIQDRGVDIGGRDPSNNVVAALTRDARFFRPSRGTYFLRELAKGPITHVGVRHARKGA